MPSIVTKGPMADLDFAIDWTAWLTGGDTLASTDWTVPDGLTTSKDPVVSGGKAIIWFSGGTPGQTYVATCKIVTTQGRTDERELAIRIARR